MPFQLGFPELVIILVLVLLLFGPKKLPDFAKSMGQAIREFRRASQEVMDDIHRAAAEDPKPEPAPAAQTTTATAEASAEPEAEPAAAGAAESTTKQL